MEFVVLRRPGSSTDIIDSGVVGGLEIWGGREGGTELVTGVQGVVFGVVECQRGELGVWGGDCGNKLCVLSYHCCSVSNRPFNAYFSFFLLLRFAHILTVTP